MRSALIGHTGFVGGNLARQFAFDEGYNSKNIADIRGREYDLLVCGGVSAVKWWANANAAEDRARIDALLEDLRSVRAARMIVLSTVDVYPQNSGIDETFDCHSQSNHAYGTNRLYFEDACRAHFADTTVVRISGVFGPGLKKNVIYDLMHDNCLDVINPESSFQYYNVGRLWSDLQRIQESALPLVNLVTQPVRTRAILDRFFPGKVVGTKPGGTASYDVWTRHADIFGAEGHYLASTDVVLNELGEFLAASGA